MKKQKYGNKKIYNNKKKYEIKSKWKYNEKYNLCQITCSIYGIYDKKQKKVKENINHIKDLMKKKMNVNIDNMINERYNRNIKEYDKRYNLYER